MLDSFLFGTFCLGVSPPILCPCRTAYRELRGDYSCGQNRTINSTNAMAGRMTNRNDVNVENRSTNSTPFVVTSGGQSSMGMGSFPTYPYPMVDAPTPPYTPRSPPETTAALDNITTEQRASTVPASKACGHVFVPGPLLTDDMSQQHADHVTRN